MTPRQPRPILFPYTTLFRSVRSARHPDIGRGIAAVTPGVLEQVADHAPQQRRVAARDRGVALDLDVVTRSEEHTSELQSHSDLVCRLLLEKKKKNDLSSQIR